MAAISLNSQSLCSPSTPSCCRSNRHLSPFAEDPPPLETLPHYHSSDASTPCLRSGDIPPPPSPGPVDSLHFHGTVGEDLPVHAPLVSMWQPHHCGWLEGGDYFGRAHGVACWPGLVRPPRSWARPPPSPQPAASDFWPACAVGCRTLRLYSLGLV
jgi:hypothetical protein